MVASTFGHEIDHDDVTNAKIKKAEDEGKKVLYSSERIPSSTGLQILKDIAAKKKENKN